MDLGKRTSRRAASSTWKCSNSRPASRDDALGGLLIEPVRARHHIRLGDAGDLARPAARLPLRGQAAGKACDALRALGRDDLDGEASLVAEFLDLLPRPVAQVGHDIDEIGQLALAARIEAFAVLAQEDVVDAVGVGRGERIPGRSGSA